MKTPLARPSETVYAALRIVSGLAFTCHGLQKVFGLFGADPAKQLTQVWFGGVIEGVCGALIAAGLFTPWAALLASGTMAVAYIQFHWKGRLDGNFFPIVNEGELAVIYCFLFLYVAAKGGGRFSLDARRSKA